MALKPTPCLRLRSPHASGSLAPFAVVRIGGGGGGGGGLSMAHASYPTHRRAHAALRSLALQGNSEFQLSDIEFCFEKIESTMPHFLHANTAATNPDVVIVQSAPACQLCQQPFDAHYHEIPLKVYSPSIDCKVSMVLKGIAHIVVPIT